MSAGVTHVEANVEAYAAAWAITVERHEAQDARLAPRVTDVPTDVRAALTAWLAGDQP
jgi:hypothetical protein